MKEECPVCDEPGDDDGDDDDAAVFSISSCHVFMAVSSLETNIAGFLFQIAQEVCNCALYARIVNESL